ncbi:MAG: class I SAM-dependent methyltransferase [Planctomycetota bacterium]|nr:MAG: class I SAM-dependent methyltransferase [Planctomycetota bacterium]
MGDDICPITMPGIHDVFWPFLVAELTETENQNTKILDAGAGYGPLTKKLYENGYNVSACDAHPETFKFDKLRCERTNLNNMLPYADSSFDAVVAVEVLEHLTDHGRFFHECRRILKHNGKLIVSTPNILSLKSRLLFFMSGFFYSFKPLSRGRDDQFQHVTARTLDQYYYIAKQNGFTVGNVRTDKYQSTSKSMIWLWPLLYGFTKLKGIDFYIHNQIKILLGRILFISFKKKVLPSNI